MSISRPDVADVETVERLAAAVDLPLEPGAAEELAPQFGLLRDYARLLESLDLDDVEPAWGFSLDSSQP